ncbi:putative acetyltransferase [Senna tora]|uniref:Putative acetyltransferase n=1 Tax=Senna tora TaxID=362788 RepID=A0A834XLU6_9FABA|nr:putative acetyltransferase [Senna tora]
MEGLGVISRSTVEAPNQEGHLDSKIELTPFRRDYFSTYPTLTLVLLFIILNTLSLLPFTSFLCSPDVFPFNNTSTLLALFSSFVTTLVSYLFTLKHTIPLFPTSYNPPMFLPSSAPSFRLTERHVLLEFLQMLVPNHPRQRHTQTTLSLSLPTSPLVSRWYESPIRFYYPNQTHNNTTDDDDGLITQPPPERVFHFTKQKIAELKAKANEEVNVYNKITISSLQALITHIWGCVVRHQHLDPQEQVTLIIAIGARQRILDPPLADNYFGNALHVSSLRMKAGELVEGGLGKGGLEMNKLIGSHTEEKLKSYYEGWVKNPVVGGVGKHTVVISSSPRFDVYGNDFGWGKPVALPLKRMARLLYLQEQRKAVWMLKFALVLRY